MRPNKMKRGKKKGKKTTCLCGGEGIDVATVTAAGGFLEVREQARMREYAERRRVLIGGVEFQFEEFCTCSVLLRYHQRANDDAELKIEKQMECMLQIGMEMRLRANIRTRCKTSSFRSS